MELVRQSMLPVSWDGGPRGGTGPEDPFALHLSKAWLMPPGMIAI